MPISLDEFDTKARRWYTKFNWRDNPFDAKTVIPELLIGHEKAKQILMEYIAVGGAYALVKAPIGSGKTTLLRWLQKHADMTNKYITVYFEEPPTHRQEIDNIIITKLSQNTIRPIGSLPILKPKKESFLKRLFHRKKTLSPTIHNTFTMADHIPKIISPDYLSHAIGNKRLLIFFDEAHLSSESVAYRIKDITDMNKNVRLILSAASTPQQDAEAAIPAALLNRISPAYKVSLQALSRQDAKKLVFDRIQYVGGKGWNPFSDNIVELVCAHYKDLPRAILLFMNYCVTRAIREGLEEIDVDNIEKFILEYDEMDRASGKITTAIKTITPEEEQAQRFLAIFSREQIEILNQIATTPYITISQLSEKLDKKDPHLIRVQINRINEKMERQKAPPLVLTDEKLIDGKNVHVYWIEDQFKRFFMTI